jgi:hypothetical protein
VVAKNDGSWNSKKQSDPSMGKDPLTRQPDQGYPKPRDISKRVDPSAARSDGFSAKLDKSE